MHLHAEAWNFSVAQHFGWTLEWAWQYNQISFWSSSNSDDPEVYEDYWSELHRMDIHISKQLKAQKHLLVRNMKYCHTSLTGNINVR